MIQWVKGNIFDSNANILINPTNCIGPMGAGLAKQFANRFPGLESEYKQWCRVRAPMPGNLFIHYTGGMGQSRPSFVVCLPTKVHWANPSRLSYVELGLESLRTILREAEAVSIANPSYYTVAIPPLGCGLGGLNWSEVKPLMVKYLDGIKINVEVYEP